MAKRTSRRRFLGTTMIGSGTVMATALLAACGSGTSSPQAAASAPAAAPTAGQAAPTTGPAATAPATNQSASKITVWWGVGPQQKAVATDVQKANPKIQVELAELGQNVYGNPKYL